MKIGTYINQTFIFLSLLLLVQPVHSDTINSAGSPTINEQACPETLNFIMHTLAGDEPVNLCREYLGKVVMVVNTASKCGYTPQYDGLEALYKTYRERGFVVLGFPSNDFGGQEPGTDKQIVEFCRLTYGVQFPMFKKTRVAQKNADPIYQTLAKLSGEYPGWNFHKYIIDRNGNLAASYKSKVLPQSKDVVELIEQLL